MATTEFADAAAAQARSLGFEPAVVWVDHPIQNRTTAELADLANRAIEPILRAISASPAAG